MRALDHVVWPTRDLDGLAETFRCLGFTVGARNRHPWGTVNHIVQFDGCFLELLGFADDSRPVHPDDPAFPFAGFCSAYLDRLAGGAAMLVLASPDAAADAARFQSSGLGPGRLLPFSRKAEGPDGADRTVAFTVAFADLPGLPGIGAFTCQQHRPENFWRRALQRHENGALGIAAVTIEAPDASAAVAALQSFVGGAAPPHSPEGAAIALANSRIAVVPRTPGRSLAAARVTAVDIAIGDPDDVSRRLDRAGLSFSAAGQRIVVPAHVAGGTALGFVRAG